MGFRIVYFIFRIYGFIVFSVSIFFFSLFMVVWLWLFVFKVMILFKIG